MIVNKKELICILGIIFFIIIFSAFIMYGCGTAIVTVSDYNKPITVVIDAGHGGEDGGAVAADGTLEKNINLKIATYLCEFFKYNNINTVMTRTKDIAIYDDNCTKLKEKKVSDMHNRLKIFNDKKTTMVISIHQNKFEQAKYYGTQVFYSPNNQKSNVLAENIKNSVTRMLQPDNTRECKKATKSIYLLYNCNNPSVIVECGFLSNNNELEKLKSEEYQKRIAFSIYCGCMEYLTVNSV